MNIFFTFMKGLWCKPLFSRNILLFRINLCQKVDFENFSHSVCRGKAVCVNYEKDMALRWQIYATFVTVLWCSKTESTLWDQDIRFL